MKRETRSVLDSLHGGRFDRVRTLPLILSDEFKQLLLTSIEGLGVVYEVILIGSKFVLLQQVCALY